MGRKEGRRGTWEGGGKEENMGREHGRGGGKEGNMGGEHGRGEGRRGTWEGNMGGEHGRGEERRGTWEGGGKKEGNMGREHGRGEGRRGMFIFVNIHTVSWNVREWHTESAATYLVRVGSEYLLPQDPDA